jgi:hypothetical protein
MIVIAAIVVMLWPIWALFLAGAFIALICR